MAREKAFDKDEVLRKALNLFWEKGYNATSMQDLIDGLGISRSSLYDTFGDKRSLYVQALEAYRQTASVPLVQLIDNATDIRQFLKRLFSTTIRECTSADGSKGCFVTNAAVELAPHDDDIAKFVQEDQNSIEDALTRAFDKAQADGQITSKESPRSLARFILNTITGLRIVAKSHAGKKKYDDIVQVTLSVLDR